MPYSLISDTFADDPVWEVLAAGSAGMVDSLQAAYVRLNAKASHLLTDGYLTEQTALRYCRGRRAVLDRLTVGVLDRPPLLHRAGDQCPCLGEEWVDGYDYRIHGFLKRNPSRAEYTRNRAQKADLRDARLKGVVYARDGGCCRYCRSGPLNPRAVRSRDRRKALQYDHVDPDKPAGIEGANLVVSCARCNEYKGRRTPVEADIVLLDEPTSDEIAAWQARGLHVYDQPATNGSLTDQIQIKNQSMTESKTDQKPNNDPSLIPIVDPAGIPDHVEQASAAHDDPVGDQKQRRAGLGTVPHGSGREPPVVDRASTAQPVRGSADPDVYTRRSRAGEPEQEHGD